MHEVTESLYYLDMPNPAISVIVPVYNVEQYLERCVNSILGQTFSEFEIILVDDCSPDSSPLICDELAKKDNRIKVEHLPKNLGLSGARNQGLKIAKGEYVVLIDSDDWVQNNYLQVLVDKAKSTSSEITACFVLWTSKEPKELLGFRPPQDIDRLFNREEALINVLTTLNDIAPMATNKLYKTSLFKDVEYPEGVIHEDVLTTYKLVSKVNRVCYTTETTYFYFQSPQSIMRGKFDPKRLLALDHLDEIDNYLADFSPRVKEAVAFSKYAFMLGILNAMLYENNVKKERRELIVRLRKLAPQVRNSEYLSPLVKLSLSLLRWPYVYESAKKIHNLYDR